MRTLACVLGAVLLVSCGGDGAGGTGGPVAECDALASELDEALLQWLGEKYQGIAGELRVGDCVWRGAAGASDTAAGTAAHPDDLFRVASVTKSFVATTVVALQDEGLLSLDDAIGDHVNGIPNEGIITIRHVLSHRSGLYNYTAHDLFDGAADYLPEELLALSSDGPQAPWAPGEGFDYSNTNYIVAGLIIEAVTGGTAAAAIRDRILTPLDLRSTYLEGAETAVPGLLSGYGYFTYPGTGLCGPDDISDLYAPSALWTAGAIVSSVADLVTFYEALLSGQVVSEEGLAQITTWHPAESQDHSYGLGLQSSTGGPLGTIVAHGGSVRGFRSLAGQYVDQGATLALLRNCNWTSVEEEALVDTMQQVLVDLL